VTDDHDPPDPKGGQPVIVDEVRPHEWTAVGHVTAADGRVGVVQSCSCGAVRTVVARWVEWDA
jgi:hypothetical protein